MYRSYQCTSENSSSSAADRRHQRENQQNRGEEEPWRRQVQRRLSQIIGSSCTVVIFTGADEVVVYVAVRGHLAQVEPNNNSLEHQPTKNQLAEMKHNQNYNVGSQCAQRMHLLKLLKHQGMPIEKLSVVAHSLIVSRIL